MRNWRDGEQNSPSPNKLASLNGARIMMIAHRVFYYFIAYTPSTSQKATINDMIYGGFLSNNRKQFFSYFSFLPVYLFAA